ncbi:transposase, partial [Kitasatospora sp. NPDC054795]
IVSGKSNMSKRYTAEFKRDAIALVRSSPHRNVTEIARELGVSPEGLRGWVKQAKVDRGEGPVGALTSDEKDELARLRRQNREQQQTIEILKKPRCTQPVSATSQVMEDVAHGEVGASGHVGHAEARVVGPLEGR